MYEITYLEKVGAQPYKLDKLILDLGGEVVSSKTWGEKVLAYPIKKQDKAIFTTVIFNLPKENIAKLKQRLNLEEDILRYLIIAEPIQAKPLVAEKKEKKKAEKEIEKAVAEVVESKELEAAVAPTKSAEKAVAKAKPRKKKEAVTPKKKKEEAVAEKALDESLKEIIEE